MRRAAESAPDAGSLTIIQPTKPHQIELRKAGAAGTEIHNILTKIISGEPFKESPFSKSVLAGYRLWKRAYAVDIYYTDVFVYSRK